MTDPSAAAGDAAGSKRPVRRDHVTVHRRPLADDLRREEQTGARSHGSARARAPISQRWKAVLGAAGMVAGAIALTVLIRRFPGGRFFR